MLRSSWIRSTSPGQWGSSSRPRFFLDGFTAVRWQAYLAEAPKRFALIGEEEPDVFRPPPSSWAAVAALGLFGVNAGLFAFGVRLVGDEASETEEELALAILISRRTASWRRSRCFRSGTRRRTTVRCTSCRRTLHISEPRVSRMPQAQSADSQ
jgi:hypothetical protein